MHGRGGTYMAGGHAWQGGACVAGRGMRGRGHAWQGGMCDRGACHACPPPRHHEVRSVMLLECILVIVVIGFLQTILIELRTSDLKKKTTFNSRTERVHTFVTKGISTSLFNPV